MKYEEHKLNLLISSLISSIIKTDEELVNFLNRKLNIYYFGDLVNYPYADLVTALKKEFSSERANYYLRKLKRITHEDNYFINGEYDDVKLMPEDALKGIEDLNLSTRTYNTLRRNGIYYFGDLLELTLHGLTEIRNLGTIGINEICASVYQAGFKFKDDNYNYLNYLSELEFLEAIKDRGENLLSDLGFSKKLITALNDKNIYTVNELLNFGLEEIALISLIKEDQVIFSELLEQFKNGELLSSKHAEMIKKVNLMINNENNLIKARILEKEALISELQNLIKEKTALIAEEKELDQEISSLKKSLKKS